MSFSNGPGARAVLWLQGCSLDCPGCINPNARDPSRGRDVSIDEIARDILTLGDSIEGITLSGGEPLDQPLPLTGLLKTLRAKTHLSILLFTGYEWPNVESRDDLAYLLRCLDVAIAGPYVAELHVGRGLLASSNQEIRFLSKRYTPADFEAIPESEIIVSPGGDVVMTGIEPTAPA